MKIQNPINGISKTLPHTFSLIKIKNFFQTNDKIGKVSSSVLVMISRFIELFLADILNQMASVARNKKQKTIKKKHLDYVIQKKKRFLKVKKE
mmetsp:Transcript_73253/g.152945  ORF Transcript_73253/g.152945 Transcript_73253/m.152945 type:complete len:93 (-) Transcript_73253:1090-1368(-)